MKKKSSYVVYNAAAGSGKTYTLVRDYLLILFSHPDSYYFKHILAVTFTNKAATEMKERVLQTLKDFALDTENDMRNEIMASTLPDVTSFKTKAKKILESILDDYSSFNITTIDSFTHRLMRTFAFDFGLSLDFNVELDADKVLQQAVDLVIAKIGLDDNLTKALIDFSLQQSDDDKAWDISKNLFEFSKILLNETDKTEFHSLLNKSYDDFSTLQKKIKNEIKVQTQRMREIGREGLEIILDAGLQPTDFTRSQFPNHFINLKENYEKCSFFDQSALKRNVEERVFYAKKTPKNIADAIEQILPSLLTLYDESEKLYTQINIRKLWDESIFPLMLLNYVFQMLERVKSDENIQFIADFNEKIASKVKNEPAPYIYERLGEKFKHYFIDEMQDTSVLQWSNLISLIDNALSQENGSLLLVGDAKQSIYRWRGGKPEQFISLSQQDNNQPFKIVKEVKNLDVNYRSYNEIVKFNNDFFIHISEILQDDLYKNLYQTTVVQGENTKKGGYVEIEFVKKEKPDEIEDEEEQDPVFPKKVLEKIQNLDARFQWKDICVLVRKNTQGNAVAQYLMQHGIEVISSENLLLSQNKQINFLINLMQSLYQPKDENLRFELLYYLYEVLQPNVEQHTFFEQFIKLTQSDFFKNLHQYHIIFDPKHFYQKTLYDGFEYLVRTFQMNKASNIYLVQFAELVYEYQMRYGSDLGGFVDYWEEQKDSLSIAVSESKNAVRIMSIHKSKGLQFPVVIYPYDLKLYETRNPKVWYHFHKDNQPEGFDKLMIPYKKELKYTDGTGAELYQNFRNQLELDNFNLVYVTLTRAVEQLYIITNFGLTAIGELQLNNFSGLFTRFLQHKGVLEDEKMVYSFGNKSNGSLNETTSKSERVIVHHLDTFVSSDYTAHNLMFYTQQSTLWNTDLGKATYFGTVTHSILSQIITQDEMPIVLNQFEGKGIISNQEKRVLADYISKLCSHHILKKYFEPQYKVYCEREIYVPKEGNFIPDRIVFFNEKQIGILDYKTGQPAIEHEQQIQKYADILSEMGLEVTEKWLVYLGEEIELR